MPLIERVRRLFGDAAYVVVECRHCGTTLETETDSCEYCGSERVVRYVIE